MSLLGIRLQMLIGPMAPLPAPLKLNEALQSVRVTNSDEGRSGFELTFMIGRGLSDLKDYALLTHPLLQPFNRVILIVYFNITPHSLMDGIITNRQLTPSDDPGASTLTLTGEDVSLIMDLKQESRERIPGQPDNLIVQEIINKYTPQIGLIPAGIPELLIPLTPPNPTENSSTRPQHSTDLEFLNTLAEKYGYVFYVQPTEVPGFNQAYWGKPKRLDLSQNALSVNMGAMSNVSSINFQHNSLAPNKVRFLQNGREQVIAQSNLGPPLVSQPAQPRREVFFSSTEQLSGDQVRTQAQGMFDKSMEEAVTASGELDALRYGRMLKARAKVDLRGAGFSYDGTYYVKSVGHSIDVRTGEYKQNFTLTRDGHGALSPFVRP